MINEKKQLSKKMKPKIRKMMGISLNPEEHEAVKLMMASGGYSNFSQFAKSRLFGAASETENRLKAVEFAIENLFKGYERHHKQWVDTVKQVTGTDSEPLIAAIFYLQMLMARPQDRATLSQWIDLDLVQATIKDEDNGYRKT